MFEKCITCDRIGESCIPNLLLLPFPELIKWCDKRQKYLGWSNQTLADKTDRFPAGTINRVPVGTINRIKTSEEDCKFSTMQSILITLFGGTTDEFACTEQVEKELRQMEQLEHQAARLSVAEAENERLKSELHEKDEQHRKDIRAIREEYLEQIAFLKEQLRAWQAHHQ